jgi:uncharacterized protein YcbK (DUF882 family)
MNENGRPIVLTKRATTASSALLPCGGRELAPPPPPPEVLETEVIIEVTPENQAALDALAERDAGLPLATGAEANKWFIDVPKEQLTKNLFLKHFKLPAVKAHRKGLPKKNIHVPHKYWDNVKILADNLQVLCDYLYDGNMLTGQLKITSAFRPPEYNDIKPNKGAPNSQHKFARAVDIKFDKSTGITPRMIFLAITDLIARGRMRDGGLGYYHDPKTPWRSFVHYDVRPGTGGVAQVKTTKDWTGARGGYRWYEFKGPRKSGLHPDVETEVREIEDYVAQFGGDPDRLKQRTFFKDKYWLANAGGFDDAASPR